MFGGSKLSYVVAGLLGLLGGLVIWAVINRVIPDAPAPKIVTVTPAEIELNSVLDGNPDLRGVIKHEINVFNHTDEPYYQIWIKLVTDSQRAAELRLELPPADTQLGPVRVTSKAYAFMGIDRDNHRALLVLIPRLGPRTPLTFRLANVSPEKLPGNEPFKIRVALLGFRKDPVPIIEGAKDTKTFMGTPFQFPEEGFQVVALGMGFDVKTAENSEPNSQPISKPIILPNVFVGLVIDSVGAESVQYHLQVENGPFQIKNVRVLSNTSEFSGIEIEPPARVLPPNKDFSIRGLPAVFYPTKYTHLDVTVGYTANINGTEKDFISKCRFTVRPSDIKPQTINPEFRTEDEGTLQPEKEFTEAFPEYLSLPTASFGFAIDEVKDGQPNPVRFGGTGKHFLFNPIERIVTFEMETVTGRSVKLSQPIPRNKSGKHLVLLSWDETGALLGIDGIEIKDMPSQDKKRESPK